jgi:hypothetical protein
MFIRVLMLLLLQRQQVFDDVAAHESSGTRH